MAPRQVGAMAKQRAGKRLRVKRASDIRRAFTQGVSAADGRLTLRAVRREADDPGAPARLAVAVSTRHGKAVRRNRIKRLCREAFRLVRDEVAPGWDYVMIPRAGAELTLENLKLSLRQLARRLASRAQQKGSL